MSKLSTFRLAFAALGLLAMAAVSQPAAANLLVNPGFETGDLTGWTPSSAAFARADADAALVHDGSFGGVLDSLLSPPGNDVSLIQSVILPSAGTYAFGGWLRAFSVGSESGVFDQIQISSFIAITGEGDTLGDSVANFTNFQNIALGSLTRASDWAFYSGTFDYSGPAGGSALFNFNLQNSFNSTISVAAGDSFFLEQVAVPEPATLGLLGAGLLGFGFFLRRRGLR